MSTLVPWLAPLDATARVVSELDGDHRTGLRRLGLTSGEVSCFVGADMAMLIVHARLAHQVHTVYEAVDDTLLVRAQVNCSTRYDINGGDAWHFRRPSVTVSFLPRGARVAASLDPEIVHTLVGLVIKPRPLLQRYNLPPDVLPQPLRDVLEGRHYGATALATLPLCPEISGLVRDLTSSRLEGPLRALQVEARSAELFALVLAAWNSHLHEDRSTRAKAHDSRIVAAARRILTMRYANPPTVRELANELGTNKTKLNQLFKQATGVTLQAYCSQQRIERAQSLLMEGKLSLAMIAEAVGYQHQSSFTAAFRNAVGMCPREYRAKSSGTSHVAPTCSSSH